MKIRIRHRTTYTYHQPVAFGPHRMMIRPREGHDLHIESSILQITPAYFIHWMRDVNGNSIAKIDFKEESDTLMFYSELLLSHYDANPLDFILEHGAMYYPFVYDAISQPELAPFIQMLYPRDISPVRQWVRQFWKTGDQVETIALLQRLNRHINENFGYARRDESGVQTPAETLYQKTGSCRDFAVLFIEICRFWGLAARFVSGYILSHAAEAGGASTHAWGEVYLPGAGWKGFDPTTGIMTGAQHVTVAVSRDPEHAAPISGSFAGPHSAFKDIQVDVSVVQLDKPAANLAAGSVPMRQQEPLRVAPAEDHLQVQQVAQHNPFSVPTRGEVVAAPGVLAEEREAAGRSSHERSL